ncbi:12550_t:CDS:2 [Funneliformis caledonium]|uniref:12550_t:CDS:1 n=1 Tax=Funneliformis caledonium TaxID=1117310 RepID=A0A9N9HRA0_9GLOM|nr:12550_t:CDS:2 [Funneliformis caledonium]
MKLELKPQENSLGNKLSKYMSVKQAVHHWQLAVPVCTQKRSVEQAVHHWQLAVPACTRKGTSNKQFITDN